MDGAFTFTQYATPACRTVGSARATVFPGAAAEKPSTAVAPVPDVAEPELTAYDEALEDLETFETEVDKTPPTEDLRVVKLREAYESGKISREVYEANLMRLGKVP